MGDINSDYMTDAIEAMENENISREKEILEEEKKKLEKKEKESIQIHTEIRNLMKIFLFLKGLFLESKSYYQQA